jgi:hypothetical protein
MSDEQSPLPRSVSPAGAVALALVIALGAWMGMRTAGGRATDEAPMTRAAAIAAGPGAALVGLPVRTIDGAAASLRAAGTPTVVMISSETCGFCKAALRDMGQVAAGRPLSGLRLVTLEGAAAGLPMVEMAHVAGATLVGPASAAAAAHWAFQIQGTPTFVALDANGRVTGTMVGYLGPEQFRSWIDVMLGTRERPE